MVFWNKISTSSEAACPPPSGVDAATEAVAEASRALYHQLNFIADIDAASRAVSDGLAAIESDDLDDTFAQVTSELLKVADDVAAGCTASSETCQSVDGALGNSVEALGTIDGAVNELVMASQQIRGIVESIASFARQTEMLSINAQIEAARAGKAGAGFAVVATEVGGLADRIRLQSGQIRDAVGSMQQRCESVAALVQHEVVQNSDLLVAVERMREANEVLAQSGIALPNTVGRLGQFLDPLCQAREAAEQNRMIRVAGDNVSRNLRSIHGSLRRHSPVGSTAVVSGLEQFVDKFATILIEGIESPVAPLLDQLLAKGCTPIQVLDAVGKAVQSANMRQKHQHVSVGGYYLNFLAVEAAIAHLQPMIDGPPPGDMVVVLGNARGDYHSLGREMVGTFLRASGIAVKDVGVGAEVKDFVDAVRQSGARVVGVSSLLVESAKQIAHIREALNRQGLSSVKIVAGGACFVVDRDFYREVRADYVATAASDMVSLVHEVYKYEPMAAQHARRVA